MVPKDTCAPRFRGLGLLAPTGSMSVREALEPSVKPRESPGVEFIVSPTLTDEGAPFIDCTVTLSQAKAFIGNKLPITTAMAAENPSDFFIGVSSRSSSPSSALVYRKRVTGTLQPC